MNYAPEDEDDVKYKRRWQKSKCKRNKGRPHEMELVSDETRTRNLWRCYLTATDRVYEKRPQEVRDREWRCVHCRKKDVDFWKVQYQGDWEEWRRVPR